MQTDFGAHPYAAHDEGKEWADRFSKHHFMYDAGSGTDRKQYMPSNTGLTLGLSRTGNSGTRGTNSC